MDPVVIIGAGLAGWTTARELRRRNAIMPVLLITADAGDFYAKPSLSNAFSQRRTPPQLITTAAARMAADLGVVLQANTRVESIDTASQTITTSNGRLGYAQLVLATGAQPIRPVLQGDAASQALAVNSLADFTTLHGRLVDPANGVPALATPAKRVLILGAGLIGCEFANDLAAAGYHVTVVDPSCAPMAALLPKPASAALQQALAGLGVDWRLGVTVQSLSYRQDARLGDGAGTLRADLSNGLQLAADVVLSAVGLRPDTTLAQAAGLACERGIVVDRALQTSAANVYALGDAAQYASADGGTLPYVMPIMHAARALAATLSGQRTALDFPLMPVAIKTPALPIVVAAPGLGTPGAWWASEPGIWHFRDSQDHRLGFALAGATTARRSEQQKQLLKPPA